MKSLHRRHPGTRKKKSNKKSLSCCKASNKSKKCIRKRDGKEFTLPRRFSKKRCIQGPIKGFTMRSSCAPFESCL